jgi:antitoxin HicB
MRFYNFEIVIEKEAEDEGYSGYSPGLPGCFSNGRSIDEARRNMREAIQQHVASLIAHGDPVHTGTDVGRGLALRILKDAGFTVDDYLRLH